MIRRAYLAALLALACGSAVDAPEAEPVEQPAAVAVEPVVTTTSTPTPEPVVQPDPDPATDEPVGNQEPELLPRGCVTADDCLLRSSVCAPMEVGGDPVCRQPLLPEGSSCDSADECEVGLVCAWAGEKNSDARVCAPDCYSSTDYACTTAKRLPLSCGPGRRVVDVDCEVEP